MTQQRQKTHRVKEPLSVTHPALAAEWHPTKNGDLTADEVNSGSQRKVWWRCALDPSHEWEATIQHRARLGRGCPRCGSLQTLFPRLAEQWHPTKNGTLLPDDVTAGSNQKVWWKCPREPDHEWQAQLPNRTRLGVGCPYCAGQKVSITNSLALLFPQAATEWHSTKNGDLTPNDVVAGSGLKVWWQCPKGQDHEWQASLVKRTTGGQGCPFCQGLQVSVTNSLGSLFPEIAVQWHPTKCLSDKG